MIFITVLMSRRMDGLADEKWSQGRNRRDEQTDGRYSDSACRKRKTGTIQRTDKLTK